MNRTAMAKADAATERLQEVTERSVTGLKRMLYLLFAGVFFLLAGLGILLPGLPCTPFLLLTSYFLVRSSPRLNDRLLRSKLFGPILSDWQHRGGVRPRVKVWSIAVVLIAVGATILFSPLAAPLRAGIGVLAMIGICVIVRLPIADDSRGLVGDDIS